MRGKLFSTWHDFFKFLKINKNERKFYFGALECSSLPLYFYAGWGALGNLFLDFVLVSPSYQGSVFTDVLKWLFIYLFWGPAGYRKELKMTLWVSSLHLVWQRVSPLCSARHWCQEFTGDSPGAISLAEGVLGLLPCACTSCVLCGFRGPNPGRLVSGLHSEHHDPLSHVPSPLLPYLLSTISSQKQIALNSPFGP